LYRSKYFKGLASFNNEENTSTTFSTLLVSTKITTTTQEKPNVKIFDLNAPLIPENLYASIKCTKSASFYNVTTTLCLHNLENDVFVSGSISSTGIWERDIMSNEKI